jgi:hypothetical protein
MDEPQGRLELYNPGSVFRPETDFRAQPRERQNGLGEWN